MASATVTAKARLRGLRLGRFWPGSRIGRTIIALNVIGLLVLVGGALVLNETRRALIEAHADSLRLNGEFMVNFLADYGATAGFPEPRLDPGIAYQTLLTVGIPETRRVRIFDRDVQLVADSYIVSDRIETRELPDMRRPRGPFGGIFDSAPSESDVQRANAELTDELLRAFTGQPSEGTRLTPSGQRVVSVSIPIRHVEAVLGILTIEGGDVDAIIARQRRALLPFILIAALVTLTSSLLLNYVIARPVLRLARAADQVRLSRARAISLPAISRRDDELGDLSRSLETMTRVLSERMDAIERFAADVAHEIRNPLTSIRSAIETLDLVKTPAKREQLMAILQQDVSRLDRLVTDISNASRLDAELSRDEPRPMELDRLVNDIVALYTETAKPGGAPVVFDRPAEPMRVVGQEGPLGQVVRNLIDNARSFTALTGRKGAQVRVSMRQAGREVLTMIEDDGPGIPPENLETVFERFYTSRPKAARIVGGAGNSGLGLSIARQITLAHGGRLWAENRTDEKGAVLGARFTLALPARRGT